MAKVKTIEMHTKKQQMTQNKKNKTTGEYTTKQKRTILSHFFVTYHFMSNKNKKVLKQVYLFCILHILDHQQIFHLLFFQ